MKNWDEKSVMSMVQITHSAINTNIPDYIIKQLNTIIFSFIWDNKERIKRKTLIGKIENGGAGMTDIESHFNALKASWVNRIKNNPSAWGIIGANIIHQFGSCDLLLKINDYDIKYLKTLPPFYTEVFQAAIKTNNLQHTKINSLHVLLNQPIWCNKHIQYKNKTLYFKHWLDKNIIFIKDLQFINGSLSEKFIYNLIKKLKKLLLEVFQLKNAIYNL